MAVKRIGAIALLIFLLFAFPAISQKVILPSGVINFIQAPNENTNPSFYQSINFENRYYFAAYFSVLPNAITQRQMQEEGTKIAERLASNTYLLETEVKPSLNWCKSLNITGISNLTTSLKLDQRLITGHIPEYALASKELPKIMVGAYGNAPQSAIEVALEKAGLQITERQWAKAGIYLGNTTLENLTKLAQLPFVYAIRLQNPADKTLNDIGRGSSGAALLNAPVSTGGRGLLGEGVTVGVGDNSDPTLHPDIRDRVISYTPGIPNNHGAHTAGTVGGAGILTYRRAGFAPKATIVSQWFAGIWANSGIYTDAYNMVITNNSYGSITGDCIYAGVYDLYSRLLDLQAFEYPQLLHAFASGNDGDNTCAPFPRAYHTVLGGYQTAKNIITVGRTDYTQVSSSSSSSGPVKDGRLKPEITGLGIINSLNGSGTGYTLEFGTSASSPNIAGGLALLYERYRQLNSGANPPGALMKAVLLNGARDVGNAGPDFRHGYGTMMLERSLRILENQRYSVGTLSQGQTKDTVISIPANTRQLKVLLYWHDPAANVLASNTLVHDLDLEVIAPGNQTILPNVLNASPEMVQNPATNGTDHTNNHEQVLINNPSAGNYTVRIKGTEILTLPNQPYAITFDFVPNELRFTSPVNGSKVAGANITFPIAWEDEGTTPGNYTLDYSLNNGTTWINIVDGLKDTTRLYFWQPGAAIRSTTAKLRLTKGSDVAISEPFAIIPNVAFSVAGVNDQCFSYFRINWTAITPNEGETIDYVVKLKQGPAMETVAEVSGANFVVLENLHPDSTYYAAIVARINGVEGVYNTAVSRRPNTGNCIGAISNGNLMLDSISSPKSGRAFTSSALTNNTPITIRMRNLDDAPANSFLLKYSINGGSFTETAINTPVAARSTFTHTFPGTDFSALGNYTITAVVTNTGSTDPNKLNDTFRVTISHLPNEPIFLTNTFTQDFETAQSISTLRPITGVAGLTHWDYINEDPLARLRTFITPGIARGNRAVSLDVSKATPRVTKPFNQLIGTFNLVNYQVNNNEVRLDFYYKHHGTLQGDNPLNKVWIRGTDAGEWVEIFDLSTNQTPLPGVWQLVTSLDLNATLKNAGQQFSTSTQIRFGQYGLYSLADNENFAGYTFDDVSLIIAQNDMQLLEIITPETFACGPATNLPVKVTVRNGMPTQLNNIPVRYRINNGSWITETIPTVAAKTALEYTFNTTVSLPEFGKIFIDAEVNFPGDNVPGNNTLKKQIINQPVISSFPYYQDFEAGPGGFVTDGLNNSWEFGTPASLRITGAASGTMAWKTRLIGDYKNNELSYLYSPCFDISTLSNPMLSFSLAYSFEDCRRFNTICDAGWMEYSLDGQSWQKLGAFGEGESWYDYEAGQVWMESTQTNWREAIIPLPKHDGTIKLRYVIRTDEGSTREGMAIDNFHIYNGEALPLRWLWFDAILKPDNKVALTWRVANPKAGETFDIQLAKQPNNESSFSTIGTVTAISDLSPVFSFTDVPDVKQGTLFYRIIWHKLNGEETISPVRKITMPGAAGNLLVYPNPADQKLQLLLKTENDNPVTIRIMSVEGRTIYSMVDRSVNGLLSTTIDLTLLRLPSGVYFIEVSDNGRKQVKKWIKQ